MVVRSIILVLVGVFASLNSQVVGQNNPFWYPQPTQISPVQNHYIIPSQFQFQHSYEFVPSTAVEVQPTHIHWNSVPNMGFPNATAEGYPIVGELEIQPIISEFQSQPTPLEAGIILEAQPVLEPGVQVEPANEKNRASQNESGNTEDHSPLDVDLQELEQQAQREAAQRVLKLDDKVQGLEAQVAELQSLLNEKNDDVQSNEPKTESENSETDKLAELKKANEKVKADLEKKLANQKVQIETLQTRLREIEESREAAKTTATNEDIARIHAELKKAQKAIRAQGNRTAEEANSQDRLRKQLDEIAEIVQREVQESIREEKERIIRSVIRRASNELRERKKNENDDRKDK